MYEIRLLEMQQNHVILVHTDHRSLVVCEAKHLLWIKIPFLLKDFGVRKHLGLATNGGAPPNKPGP